jgi:hypothetical protein
MWANVGICHAGECALVVGRTNIANIEVVKSKAIIIANVLFFSFCIFSFPQNFAVGSAWFMNWTKP